MHTYYRMDQMLTDDQVKEIVGKPMNMVVSTEFDNINDIDDLFQNANDVLILYQNNDHDNAIIGHFCALKRLDNNNLAFYDSYGGPPDEQLSHIPIPYRIKTGQLMNNLRRLLYNSKYRNIHFNPHHHQKFGKGINTCGRHSGMFMRFNMEPEKYNKFLNKLSKMTGIKNKDKLVTALTENLII